MGHDQSSSKEDLGSIHSTKASDQPPKKAGFFSKFAKKEPKEKTPMVPLMQIFRFADTVDKILIAIGLVAACAAGASMPLMTLIFSDLTGELLIFNNQDVNNPIVRHALDHSVRKYCWYFFALGMGTWVVASVQKLVWSVASERQGKRVRHRLVRWSFHRLSSPRVFLATSICLQEGISEKFSFVIQYSATFLTGIILAFVKGWKLTLVVLAVMPVMVTAASLMGILLAENTSGGQDSYAEAGGVADEVLSSIKTVMAFGGEDRELERYNSKTAKALKAGLRKAKVLGGSMGFIMFTVFSVYALGFWFGGKLARNGEMKPDQVLNAFFSLIVGGFSLGNAAPSISAVSSARGAAVKVFDIIDRKGEIELSSVNFRYPTRPDVQILHDFSISVKPGQKIALVGESGCGKSTMIGLVERFYDPESGVVKIDGVDVREYNVRSLRQQIGVIMQMPVLFGYTIYQNIIWGAIDVDNNPPTMEQVIQACKDANAHDFISELPDGYDTMCGERGALLSGGQKQRIAIARALVRNPKILLLDEATSALDSNAERVVQDALDRASANRTTITVAHRLSTIRDSDVIYVISKGRVLESGNHEELIGLDGAYAKLVEAQQLRQSIERGVEEFTAGESSGSDSPGYLGHRKSCGDQRLADEKSFRFSAPGPDRLVLRPLHQSMSLKLMTKRISTRRLRKARGWLRSATRLCARAAIKSLPRLIKMNKKHTIMFIPGFIATVIDGVAFPCFSILFSEMLVAIGIDDHDKQKHEVNKYAGLFFMLACIVFFANGGRSFFFGTAGENITYHIRYDVFRAMMRQDAAYFDKKENGTGALTSRLATEAADVNKCIGEAFPAFIGGIASIIAGVIIAFKYDWRLTLVILATLPFLIFAFVMEGKAVFQSTKAMKGAYEKASQEAAETVSNIRTVTTLTREHTFIKQFEDNSIGTIQERYPQPLYQLNRLRVCSVHYVPCLLPCVLRRIALYSQQVMYAIVFSAMALGLMAQQSSTLNKSLISAEKLLRTIESVPNIDAHSDEGIKVSRDQITGDIAARKVRFAYPTRPGATILRGITLGVTPGKTIALVGPSGSGKSTIIGLVQRLYDVLGGSVDVERTDVRQWNVKSLRSNLALVGQEPVLFDYTIAENIAYGRPDATQMEIEEVAKQANIHNFVIELPDGYNTRIGQTGGRLSGGQKQRIAIARALVRNPKILLLDEASSALDSQSEKLVQEALDIASEGRTTITIAHRLSTIQNADHIVVFKQGRIIEHGTHDQLLEQKGLYSLLVAQQSLQITH
ncbi:multidrug resistance protein 3 [Linderina pennispora]|uniref:Multidrug resistance protein 3 n=1 Tax=Linderina pennispora TaxID=61395 RepID=A0A1Y1WMA1_9FUNG|nr:multidrug resistance protein 3 [Linderina pennispora]ORX74418.1 multidrug resistance protein 3 [Linderina pennispora]